MNIERKAWKNLHRLIQDGLLTDKESWELACGIFKINIEYYPQYIPSTDIQMPFDTSSIDEQPQINETTVKGFAPTNN